MDPFGPDEPPDEHDDQRPSRAPLPPDDRIWRHPSELAAGTAPAFERPRAPTPPSRRRVPWWTLAIAFGAGVGLTVGLLAVSGRLDDEPSVVEQVQQPTGEQDPSAIAEKVMDSTVHLQVTTPDGTRDGSGVVFRDDGHVLTTAALVEGATEISATIDSGSTLDAVLVGADPITDLAVLRLPGDDWPAAVLAEAAGVDIGERIIAVGASASPGAPSVVTLGVVQARGVRLVGDTGTLYDLILASEPAPLPPGGVLLDQDGAVVAVVTDRRGTIADLTSDIVDISATGGGAYAVPIEQARPIAAQLIATGAAHHAWLGTVIDDDAQPASITATTPDSPAEAAGLVPDDIILSIDGTPTPTGADVTVALRHHAPDDRVVVRYRRAGEAHEVEVQLAELR